MSSQERIQSLDQVRDLLKSGELTTDLVKDQRLHLLDRITTLGEYIVLRQDMGEIAPINGTYRPLERNNQRSPQEITGMVLKLRGERNQLIESGANESDSRIQKIDAQREILTWLCNGLINWKE